MNPTALVTALAFAAAGLGQFWACQWLSGKFFRRSGTVEAVSVVVMLAMCGMAVWIVFEQTR